MKATNKSNFVPVPLPPEDRYLARCFMMIHIGHVPNNYMGVDKGVVERIYVGWELLGRVINIDTGEIKKIGHIFDEEKGMELYMVGNELTLSTNDKANLSDLIESWRGYGFSEKEKDGFDPTIMLGKPCMIYTKNKRKKDYKGMNIEKITSENSSLIADQVLQLPKSITKVPKINEDILFDWEAFNSNNFDPDKFKEIFSKVPKWLQEKIKTSEEYEAISDLVGEDNSQNESYTEQDDTGAW